MSSALLTSQASARLTTRGRPQRTRRFQNGNHAVRRVGDPDAVANALPETVRRLLAGVSMLTRSGRARGRPASISSKDSCA